jgi:hypothetical protein
MKKIFKLSTVALATLILVNCSDEDTSTPISSKSIVLDASSKTAWKYYSFEKNDTVAIANPETSVDWDIAFMRYMVKTNGGKSGSGQAEVFKSSLTDQAGFDALTTVPDTAVFTKDDTVKVYGYNPANPQVPSVTNYILNAPLYTWYALKTGTSSTLVPTNAIYVLKTAKGKYAKLWIKSYYKEADATPGFISISYTYQGDGSKNLK